MGALETSYDPPGTGGSPRNIALMVFVDMLGSPFPEIHHSPWDGIHLADFVMPFFDFIVGVSLAFSVRFPRGALLRSVSSTCTPPSSQAPLRVLSQPLVNPL